MSAGDQLVDDVEALKRALLAARNTTTSHGQDEDDVTVEGLGTVRVRGLNRIEVMGINRITDPVVRERHMIACGVVRPTFTLDEAAEWQRVSAGGAELEDVTYRIAQLSRMVEGADKSDGR